MESKLYLNILVGGKYQPKIPKNKNRKVGPRPSKVLKFYLFFLFAVISFFLFSSNCAMLAKNKTFDFAKKHFQYIPLRRNLCSKINNRNSTWAWVWGMLWSTTLSTSPPTDWVQYFNYCIGLKAPLCAQTVNNFKAPPYTMIHAYRFLLA